AYEVRATFYFRSGWPEERGVRRRRRMCERIVPRGDCARTTEVRMCIVDSRVDDSDFDTFTVICTANGIPHRRSSNQRNAVLVVELMNSDRNDLHNTGYLSKVGQSVAWNGYFDSVEAVLELKQDGCSESFDPGSNCGLLPPEPISDFLL